MDTAAMLVLFAMFCLMLAFLAVFARRATATVVVKTLCKVFSELFKSLTL